MPPEKIAFTNKRAEIFLRFLQQFYPEEATVPTQIKMIHKEPKENIE